MFDVEPLYVGDWIEASGVAQKDVVKATGISQGYIANMSGGRKLNPSAAKLRRIARYLDITVDDLYRQPPKLMEIGGFKEYSPSAREMLMRKIVGKN